MRQTFCVPGAPVPKGRPRTFLHGGRLITTTPPATRLYERKVAECALAAGIRLQPGAVVVDLRIYLPDLRRRDWDNCAKGILDALNGIAFRDDSDIFDAFVHKRVSRHSPRAEVLIAEFVDEIEEAA